MRAIWKGSISFGLVNIPVALHNASRVEELKFRLLRSSDLSPVNYKRVADIVDFVELADINPVFFYKPYYLEPLKGGASAYNLLRRVLAETGKAGISKVVIRTRQHLAAVKCNGNLLVLELMRFEDELLAPSAVKVAKEKEPRAREFAMARTLVNQMSDEWNPHRYADDYKSALMKLIDRKVASGGKVLPETGKKPKGATNVIDLAAVLQESLAQATGAKSPKQARRRKGQGGRRAA